MIHIYVVDETSQKLISGSWGDPDCVWDWETKSTEFKTEQSARQFFDKAVADIDTPIIRIYKVPCVRDEVFPALLIKQFYDAELIDEKYATRS